MPFIAFLGCDGSGKSAVINNCADLLRDKGIKVVFGHWCPKNCCSDSVSKSISVDNPHGKKPRGCMTSILKLIWLWFIWWLAWFRYLARNSREGYVLFDRFHGDLLIDPQRYRYGAPLWLAHFVSFVMPKPNLIIFLDAEPEVLLSRKQEVSYDNLIILRRNYLNFAKTNNSCTIVDASNSLELVTDEVMSMLLSIKSVKIQ